MGLSSFLNIISSLFLERFQFVLDYQCFLNKFKVTFQNYRDYTENCDDIGHNNRKVKCSYRDIMVLIECIVESSFHFRSTFHCCTQWLSTAIQCYFLLLQQSACSYWTTVTCTRPIHFQSTFLLYLLSCFVARFYFLLLNLGQSVSD